MRCGVIACPIWKDIDGEYLVLVHYLRSPAGDLVFSAVYTRYNGVLTNITDKMRNLKMIPDWRDKLRYAE